MVLWRDIKKIDMQYIAHAGVDEHGNWQIHDLGLHLTCVADKSRSFADVFGNGDWAKIAGLWHDLGKFLPDWQKYIRRRTGYNVDAHIEGNNGRPNHSTAGAVLSLEQFKLSPVGRIIAYIVAGHHVGLPDWQPDAAGGDLVNRTYEDALEGKLDIREINIIKNIAEANNYIRLSLPKTAPLRISNPEEMSRRQEHLHLWIRMLFSCLVDADFLNTESVMGPETARMRGQYPSLEELHKRFESFKLNKLDNAAQTKINEYRRAILEKCRVKAALPPGFFSLTVPTGGGKTFSSMAFALTHALKYNKTRIITAIPYTSIIEQTAKVYKFGSDDEENIQKTMQNGDFLFGEGTVLEHHSNIDPDKEDSKSRLAAENWDAPVIITTNVQLFESLLASRTSSCRKLHNIVNSVIILDEAQMLPPEYLEPILSVLKGLVQYFGVTVLFCTATQPALCGNIGSGLTDFKGLGEVREIVDNPETLAGCFRRVEIMPPDLETRMEWKVIAQEIQEYEQVLCIVNTRKDCRDLHALMPKGTVHLSANMCGEERSEAISVIKRKLRDNLPIRVISTQLVEAGVDIDFPVVYRALAGVDSMVQAAGRCNREAKLNAQGRLGKVVIFQPPKQSPVGLLRKGEDAAKAVLRNKQENDFSPGLYADYFKQYYSSINDFDRPKFKERLTREAGEFKFQFRTFSQDVRLIDDTIQQGIIVRFRGKTVDSNDLIGLLRNRGPELWLLRKLQRFVVNVPLGIFYKLRDHDHIEQVHSYWIQKSSGLYRPGYGLLSDIHDWDDELYFV